MIDRSYGQVYISKACVRKEVSFFSFLFSFKFFFFIVLFRSFVPTTFLFLLFSRCIYLSHSFSSHAV